MKDRYGAPDVTEREKFTLGHRNVKFLIKDPWREFSWNRRDKTGSCAIYGEGWCEDDFRLQLENEATRVDKVKFLLYQNDEAGHNDLDSFLVTSNSSSAKKFGEHWESKDWALLYYQYIPEGIYNDLPLGRSLVAVSLPPKEMEKLASIPHFFSIRVYTSLALIGDFGGYIKALNATGTETRRHSLGEAYAVVASEKRPDEICQSISVEQKNFNSNIQRHRAEDLEKLNKTIICSVESSRAHRRVILGCTMFLALLILISVSVG